MTGARLAGKAAVVVGAGQMTGAHAALFLASEEAQFITGVVLAVDGGQSALVG